MSLKLILLTILFRCLVAVYARECREQNCSNGQCKPMRFARCDSYGPTACYQEYFIDKNGVRGKKIQSKSC